MRKPVNDYEGLYEVDEGGSVYSVKRPGPTPYGVRSYGGVQLKPVPRGGHMVVSLHRPGTPCRTRYVQRIVLTAFVGPAPAGMVACHNDGNSANNALSNLRWDTPKANSADMVAHGTSPRGERNGNAILTEQDVLEIRKKLESRKAQAARYGVSLSMIRKVRGGEAWRHVTAWAVENGVDLEEV